MNAPIDKWSFKLLPCPFCGGEASVGTSTITRDKDIEGNKGTFTGHFINCMICGADNQGIAEGYRTPELAAEKWNRRITFSSDERSRAIEECAQVADDHRSGSEVRYVGGRYERFHYSADIGQAIRALKNAAPQAESPRVSDGQVDTPRASNLPPAAAAPSCTLAKYKSTLPEVARTVGEIAREIAPGLTIGEGIDGPYNACMFREACRAMKKSLTSSAIRATEPTEDEVRLGAKVIAESPLIDAPKLPFPSWMGLSRSILQAALAWRYRAAPSSVARSEVTDEMVSAALAFHSKGNWLTHPDVRPYNGTANGDSPEAWNRDYFAAMLKHALSAIREHKPGG